MTDYRYTGANPNNYVYFGCSDACTEDNLYRVIGVIPTIKVDSKFGLYENRVKLIKANYYTENESGYLKKTNASYPAKGGYGYQWNSSNSNRWDTSTLQTKVLNEVFWNSLGDYQKYIEPAKWYLGAHADSNNTASSPDQIYFIERSTTKAKSSGSVIFYLANIGLMYFSDYGYSLGGEFREESLYKNASQYVSNAWLYRGEGKYIEWTINPESSTTPLRAYKINASGTFSSNEVYNSNYVYGIRPTFYLKADVQYVSGEGSLSNPYRIEI